MKDKKLSELTVVDVLKYALLVTLGMALGFGVLFLLALALS